MDYPLDSVYIYHEKRFIFSLKTSEKQTCGVIEIPDQISVNIFKTEIESYYELNQLKNYI